MCLYNRRSFTRKCLKFSFLLNILLLRSYYCFWLRDGGCGEVDGDTTARGCNGVSFVCSEQLLTWPPLPPPPRKAQCLRNNNQNTAKLK